MQFIRHYLVAVQHFTRMPEAPRAGALHWPGVGWFVGLVACVSFAATGLLLHGSPFSPLVAAVASTMATVLLTRAFHEDGLARFADGLRGPASSGLGSFGVLALVLVVLAKISLLAILAGHSPSAVLLALICAHVVTRFWPLILLRTLPHGADAQPNGDPLAAGITQRELGLAAAWCAPALIGTLALQGTAFVVLALLFSGAAMAAMKLVLQRRGPGLTADAVGATQQICEVGFYFGAAMAWGAG